MAGCHDAVLLAPGQPLPAFTLATPGGSSVRSGNFKQRQPLVLVATRDIAYAACREWLRRMARYCIDLSDLDAHVLVIASNPQRVLQDLPDEFAPLTTGLVDKDGVVVRRYTGAGEMAVCAADRYGYVAVGWIRGRGDGLPAPAAVVTALRDAEQSDCACSLPAW